MVRMTLGAEVTVDGFSVGRQVTARTISLRDPGHAEPFLTIEGLSISYSKNPFANRYIKRITVDTASLSLDARHPDATNFECLVDRFRPDPTQEPEEDPSAGAESEVPVAASLGKRMRFVPIAVSVDDVQVRARVPEQEVSLRGIHLLASVYQADYLVVYMNAVQASGETVEQDEVRSFEYGWLRARFSLNGTNLELEPFDIALPGIAEVQGWASGTFHPGLTSFNARLNRMQVSGALISPFAAYLPVPVAFREMVVEDSSFAAAVDADGLTWLETRIVGQAEGLVVGPLDTPWYEGHLAVQGSATLNEADIEITPGVGSPLYIAANRDEDGIYASMRFMDWPRESVTAVLPPGYADRLQPLAQAESLSGEATLSLVDDTARIQCGVNGRIETVPETTEDLAISLSGSLPYPPVAPFPAMADVALTLGGGSATAHVEADNLVAVRATATLEAIRLDALARMAAGIELPEAFRPTATGSVQVEGMNAPVLTGTLTLGGLGNDRSVDMMTELHAQPASAGTLWPAAFQADTTFSGTDGRAHIEGTVSGPAPLFEVRTRFDQVPLVKLKPFVPSGTIPEGSAGLLTGTADLRRDQVDTTVTVAAGLADAVLGAWPLGADPVQIDTVLTLANDLSAVTTPLLGVRAGTWIQGGLRDLKLALDPFDLEGGLNLQAEGPGLPEGLPLGGGVMAGTLLLKGPLRYHDGQVELKASLDAPGLGYGEWQTSSGRSLVMDLPLGYQPGTSTLSLGPGSGTWGDGVSITLDAASGTLTPLALDIPFKAEADLALAAELGLVDTVEAGQGRFTGTVSLEPEGFAVRLDGTATAELLALANALATAGGVSFEGTPEYGPGNHLGGTGRVGVASAAGFGITTGALQAQWRGDGPTLTLEELSGEVFGGTFHGHIRIDPLDPTLPGEAEIRFEGIDLARFTEEFKPGDVKLTGLASGSVSGQWTAAGIISTTFSMVSNEGFSMNRDMIEQLLFSQYSEGMTGGKTLKEIREGILGESPQYPFDSAQLDLTFSEGRFRGNAVFRSKKLNLTIEPAIDEQVLYEALRLRQEAGFDKLEAIRTDPITWSE